MAYIFVGGANLLIFILSCGFYGHLVALVPPPYWIRNQDHLRFFGGIAVTFLELLVPIEVELLSLPLSYFELAGKSCRRFIQEIGEIGGTG